MYRHLLARRCIAVIILILCLAIPLTSFAANVPRAVLKAADSVVYIEAGIGNNAAAGSGFVIFKDNDGTYIATNNHVIEDSENSVYVWISESIRERADVVAKSKSQDLAILHLSVELDAKPLTLSAKASQGEEVFAIGFPAGADVLSSSVSHVGSEATITSGIISSIRNSNLVYDTAYIKILQISVDINAGNSGGPLLNNKGQVLGISAFGVIETQGINGAISAEELMTLVKTYNLFELPKETSFLLQTILIGFSVPAFVVLVWLSTKRLMRKHRKPLMLSEYLSALNAPLSCSAAVSLLMPIALNLKSKHDSGSVSLRIFPASIGVTEAGCVLFENNDRPTERFLSPEQRKGSFAGIAADIFAFCAVLDYMLEVRLQKHEEEENDAESKEMRRIIKKGLAGKTTARYSSIQELIFDLAPLNTGISAEALLPFSKRSAQKKRSNNTANEKSLITADDLALESKTNKRKKKKVLILLSATLMVIILAGGALFSIINKNIALAKLDAFNFNQAVEIFERIPFGSILFPVEQKYISAAELVVNKQFDAAKDAFERLGDYRESKPAMREVIYQKGLYEISSGNFSEASDILSVIKGYRDASDLEQYARYLRASDLSSAGKYDDALKLLFTLIKEKYEPAKRSAVDVSLAKAQKQANEGSFGAAYQTLEKIKEYGDVNATLSLYRDEAYKTGVSLFRSASYLAAEFQFEAIGNYLRAIDYITLIDAHLGSSKITVNNLINLIGFEDASELLVKNQKIAQQFLTGTWQGEGKYFTMKSDGYINYNLPYFNYGYYYRIENGIVLIYPKNDYTSTKKLFGITVISEDCILILAYQNHRTYTLYRK